MVVESVVVKVEDYPSSELSQWLCLDHAQLRNKGVMTAKRKAWLRTEVEA